MSIRPASSYAVPDILPSTMITMRNSAPLRHPSNAPTPPFTTAGTRTVTTMMPSPGTPAPSASISTVLRPSPRETRRAIGPVEPLHEASPSPPARSPSRNSRASLTAMGYSSISWKAPTSAMPSSETQAAASVGWLSAWGIRCIDRSQRSDQAGCGKPVIARFLMKGGETGVGSTRSREDAGRLRARAGGQAAVVAPDDRGPRGRSRHRRPLPILDVRLRDREPDPLLGLSGPWGVTEQKIQLSVICGGGS